MAQTIDWNSLQQGKVYSLQSMSGLDGGYQNQFLLQGKQLIPIIGDASQYGAITPFPYDNYTLQVNGGGVRPLDMAIKSGQTLEQSNAVYNADLNDTTHPTISFPSEGTQATQTTQTGTGGQSQPTVGQDGKIVFNGKNGETISLTPDEVTKYYGSVDKLVSMGWTPATSNNGSTGTNNGTNTNSTNSSGSTGSNAPSGGATVNTDLPPDILNDPRYQNLSDTEKNLIKLSYGAQITTNPKDQQRAQDALTSALGLADPYLKEQIRMTQDTLNRNVTSTTADAQSKMKTLNDHISALQNDLTFNKNQLSLAQQQDMAAQLRQNKSDLFGLQQTMAENGLAFSSPRAQAESDMQANQQDIAQSTARSYAQANRSADLTASRGTAADQQNLADTQRQLGEDVTQLSRTGEAALGSQNTPDVSGVTKLGDINGSIVDTYNNKLISLQQSIYNNQDPLKLTA